MYTNAYHKTDEWVEIPLEAKKIVVPMLVLDNLARHLMRKQNASFSRKEDRSSTIEYHELNQSQRKPKKLWRYTSIIN